MPISAAKPAPIHLDYERTPVSRIPLPECTSDSGAYALGPEIGRGAMGVVYQARHRGMGRTVAMKIMRGAGFSNAEEIGRFRAETEAAARLDHPNIVPVYEVGEIFGQPFFTMKLIEGGSLSERLHQGKVAQRDAARLVAKIAGSVHHAHERGVLHRDIKPGNILLTPPTAGAEIGEPYLTDFGLAKFAGVDAALTCPGDLIGTPDYIAPEQARGSKDLTTACDVWALGVLLYQMLSGELPFNAPTPLAVLDRVKNEEPAPLECDRDLATIVARCLDKDPSHRMPTAGFLAEELERWLAGEPIRSRHITTPERVWKWMRRNPWRVAVAATLVITIVAGSITSLVMWQKAQDANFSLNAANDTLTRRNDEIASSLRLSTSTRLASESRMQVQENAQLGLLLAVESAETTRRADGKLLAESLGALYYGIQNVGGADASASRGVVDSDPIFTANTAQAVHLEESPDGRWFVTVDFTDKGVFVALFDNSVPLTEEPRRRWLLNGKRTTNIACFDMCWTLDSRELLTLDHKGGELRRWSILDGIDPGNRLPTLTETPPVRNHGDVASPDAKERHELRFIRNDKGTPFAIGIVEKAESDYPIRWRTLDPSAEKPMGPIVNVPKVDTEVRLRDRLRGSRSGKWVLNYNAYFKDPPQLLRIGRSADAPCRCALEGIVAAVVAYAFSDDDRWLAIGTADGTVRLHDLEGDSDEAISKSRVINNAGHVFSDLKFSPDGKSLLLVGGDGACVLLPFDKSGPLMDRSVRFRTPGSAASRGALSADGKWIAICCENQLVCAWPTAGIADAVRPVEFRGLPATPIDVRFSKDGNTLYALAWGGACRRWEFNVNRSGVMPITGKTGQYHVNSVAGSPDGRWIAACGQPSPETTTELVAPILLHDTVNNLAVSKLPGHVRATDVEFSPDGRWFASVGRDSTVQVWPWPATVTALTKGSQLPEPLKLIPTFKARPTYDRAIAFHPAGWIYCTCGDGRLFWWDLNAQNPAETYRERRIHSIAYILSDAAVSPDGKWLAVARHGGDSAPEKGWTQTGNMVLLFDATDPANPKPRAELRANFREEGMVAFSADNRWLAGGSQHGAPCVWDLSKADIAATRRVAPFAGNLIRGVAFPPRKTDGPGATWLAFGNADGHLHLWDWQRRQAAVCNIETSERIFAVTYLADGRLATGCGDARVRVWETDPAKLIELARRAAGRELSEGERARYR